jgi:hypothetical protein
LALCEALINAVDDSVISFLKGIAGRNTKLLGQTSAAGTASASIGRCRSLYASHRGPDAFLNLKVSLRPQFPFLRQGVASTSTFSAKHILI